MTNTFLNDNSGKSATVKREILRLCIAHNNYSVSAAEAYHVRSRLFLC